ncbi:hypothetical protein FACS1894166_01670 [Bacilli bacterium]|nr:hypothetical protein FACS1894166_01670 [Bacilli bacterium]
MSALSMSTLVFGVTIANKFDYAKNKTFGSRGYTYAVDLYSPTASGGQYIPMDADQPGESGFVHTTPQFPNDSGNNWVPNNYYFTVADPSTLLDENYFVDSYTDTRGVVHEPQVKDTTYKDIFGPVNALSDIGKDYGIPKTYYYGTYALYDGSTILPNGSG